MIRIDFLVAVPFFFGAWSMVYGPPGVFAAAAIFGPLLAALVLLSVRNSRRYGIPLPDTTWAFNLMVAREDACLAGDNRIDIERTVQNAVATWRDLEPREAVRLGLEALGDIFCSPLRFGRGVVRRMLVLVGPDTFIRQRLLPENAAYPDLGQRHRRFWDTALVVATPLLVTMALIGTFAERRNPESFAWPSLALAAAIVLFHTRTRYRVALLPALSLVAAQAIAGLGSHLGNSLAVALLAAGGAALFWALLRIRYPDDLRTESAEPP